MDNLQIYNAVRDVPNEAQKQIQAGRLRGKTDINPMWRIKILTEQFGACGIGWKYTITEKRLEKADNGEVAAFVDIDLYIKTEDGWSDPIPGTGGSSFVTNENKGTYVSDECFKMALTDAISVACKALGVAADIYWAQDRTKYDKPSRSAGKEKQPEDDEAALNRKAKIEALIDLAKRKGYDEASICKKYNLKSIWNIHDADADSCMIGFSKLPDKKDASPLNLDPEDNPFGGDGK